MSSLSTSDAAAAATGAGVKAHKLQGNSRLTARLIEVGVSPAEAERLSLLPHFSADRVAFALDRAQRRKPDRPGRYIAILLEMPDAELEGFDQFCRKLNLQRQHAYIRILEHARGHRDDANGAEIVKAAQLIRQAWPTGWEFADSRVLDDDELFEVGDDEMAKFYKIHVAAITLFSETNVDQLAQTEATR